MYAVIASPGKCRATGRIRLGNRAGIQTRQTLAAQAGNYSKYGAGSPGNLDLGFLGPPELGDAAGISAEILLRNVHAAPRFIAIAGNSLPARSLEDESLGAGRGSAVRVLPDGGRASLSDRRGGVTTQPITVRPPRVIWG